MKKRIIKGIIKRTSILLVEFVVLVLAAVYTMVPVGEKEMYIKAKAIERIVPAPKKIMESVNKSLPNSVSAEVLKAEKAKADEAYQKQIEEARRQQNDRDKWVKDLKKRYTGKLVAFTFDDGPGQYTEMLLDGLKKLGAHATFMLLGSRANSNQEVVQRMIGEGHQVGNHSWNHPVLSKMSQKEIQSEISSTLKLIQSLGYKRTCVVRPPYGDYNDVVLEEANAPVVLWNVDTEDWRHKGDVQTVYNNIMRDAHDGAIILLHDIYGSSVEAALKAMEELAKEGYQFVTVEEMFAIRDIQMEKGKRYYCAPASEE